MPHSVKTMNIPTEAAQFAARVELHLTSQNFTAAHAAIDEYEARQHDERLTPITKESLLVELAGGNPGAVLSKAISLLDEAGYKTVGEFIAGMRAGEIVKIANLGEVSQRAVL